MIKDKIAVYVRENLWKGYKIEHIRYQLLKSNYPKKDIAEVIEFVKKEHVLRLAKYINKELKQGFKPLEIRNYLVSLGHLKETVDDAMHQILLAKKKSLRKKSFESFKERWLSYWDNLKAWQKGGLVASIPIIIFSLLAVVWMMFVTISSSGKLNCYSLGTVISCSLVESVIFYALLFIAFTIAFSLPAFGVGALIYHLIWRFKR